MENEFLSDHVTQDYHIKRNYFKGSTPFNHIVIDDFFRYDIAKELAKDFREYDSPAWNMTYDNPIERYKRTCNHWDKFPATTYKVISYLASEYFGDWLACVTGTYATCDVGLHGGGWHCHKTGGKLNIHKDYSIHPKLGLERRFNLIVYLTPNWNADWGGGLELWSADPVLNGPLQCEKYVENVFNRAVLFDTTQNSWHGLPKAITCPEGVYRQSLALYYLTPPRDGIDQRNRALFAPYGDQKDDPKLLEFIEKRSKGLAYTL